MTLRRLSLRTKLGLVFWLAFGIANLVGLIGIVQLSRVNSTAVEMHQQWLPRFQIVGELRHAVAAHRNLIQRQLQTTDFRFLLDIAENSEREVDAVAQAASAYRRLIASGEERSRFQGFETAWGRYRRSHRRVTDHLDGADINAAAAEFRESTQPAYGEALRHLDGLITFAERGSERAIDHAGEIYRSALAVALALVVAAGLGAWFAAAWTRRQVSEPLLAIASAMRRVASGDLRVLGGPGRRTDEIGILETAVAGYRDSLAEGKRLAQEAAIRERQLNDAQRIAGIGHWRLERATGQMQWSDGVHALMGTRPDSYRPTLSELMKRIHPDDRMRVAEGIERSVHSGVPAQWECRLHGAGSTERTVHVDGHCEIDATGTVIALFGVCQDVTVERDLHRSLKDAKEAAEAANRAKSSFLATMSHELRTPLNAILGFSEVMQIEAFGPLAARYRDYASDINHSGRHLLDLINDVLDTARIEVGQLDLAEEPVPLGDLIRETLRLAERAAGDLGHRLELGLPSPEPVVRADRRLLKQTLINLLGNAVKFTPEGGEIRVDVSISPDRLSIAVADSGIGIPPERIAGLAQPFIQIESVMSRRHRGSGLGLYISRTLIERHGGRLRIENRPGGGSLFTIDLPASRLLQTALATA